MTGDYVSPIFIGLGFRDNFAPAREVFRGPSLIEDRAMLLEQAFERHYDYVVTEKPGWQDTGRTCRTCRDTGLCRRFGYLPMAYAAAGEDKSWLPLLFLKLPRSRLGAGSSPPTSLRPTKTKPTSLWDFIRKPMIYSRLCLQAAPLPT